MKNLKWMTVTAGFTLAVLAACDDGPTRPSTPPSGSPAPQPVALLSLVISGTDTIAPGETTQFTVTGLYSDSSFRNVTNEAIWRSTDESVLSISSTGAATGRQPGDSTIQASLGQQTATKGDVIVVPPGTYRLSGGVSEAETRRALPGARIEVTSGVGQGLSAIARDGGYRLFGVAGDIEVRVTREGYRDVTQRVNVRTHQNLSFDLVQAGPPVNVQGIYTLTVTAGPECNGVLPAEAVVRRYRASVAHDASRLRVTLDNARFFAEFSRTFNAFGGFPDPAGASFYLTGPDDFYYISYGADVIEHLSDTSLLAISGSVVTTVSPTGLSGTLSGLVEVVEGTRAGRLQRIASCRSAQHQFVLTR
jgi:hypothetical protein